MALIDVYDVQKGYPPTIPTDAEPYVLAMIDEAELELSSKIGDLVLWGRGDAVRDQRIRVVLARMVRRILMSPDGFLSETDGDYTYVRARELAGTGAVKVIRDDLDFLGISRRRLGSIRVGLPAWSPRNQHGFPR